MTRPRHKYLHNRYITLVLSLSLLQVIAFTHYTLQTRTTYSKYLKKLNVSTRFHLGTILAQLISEFEKHQLIVIASLLAIANVQKLDVITALS